MVSQVVAAPPDLSSTRERVEHLVAFVDPLAVRGARTLVGLLGNLKQVLWRAFVEPVTLVRLGLALAVWAWAGQRTSLMDYEGAMVLLGLLLATAVRQSLPSAALMATVPVRQGDLSRCVLRLALRGLKLCLFFWAVLFLLRRRDVWSQGLEANAWFALGTLQNLIILVCSMTMILLAGLPTDSRHGALPRHRRIYALAQGFFLVLLRATAVFHFAIEGQMLLWLNLTTLGLILLLTASTWQRQLTAVDQMAFIDHSRPLFVANRWVVRGLAFVSVFLVSSGAWIEAAKMVVLALLVAYQVPRWRSLEGRGLSLTVRVVDATAVLLLTVAYVAEFLDGLAEVQSLWVQLTVLASWFAFQNLVESPRQERLESKALARSPEVLARQRAAAEKRAKRTQQLRDRRAVASRNRSREPMTRRDRVVHLRKEMRRRSPLLPKLSIRVALVWLVGLGITDWRLTMDGNVGANDAMVVRLAILTAVAAYWLTPSIKLLGTLPLLPSEILRSHLRVAAEGLAVATTVLSAFWAFQWLRGAAILEAASLGSVLLPIGARLIILLSVFALLVTVRLPGRIFHRAFTAGRWLMAVAMAFIVLDCREAASTLTESLTLTSFTGVVAQALPLLLLASLGTLALVSQIGAYRGRQVIPVQAKGLSWRVQIGGAGWMFLVAWFLLPLAQNGLTFYVLWIAWAMALRRLLFSPGDSLFSRRLFFLRGLDVFCASALLAIGYIVYLQGPPHKLPLLGRDLGEGEHLVFRLAIVVIWLVVQVVAHWQTSSVGLGPAGRDTMVGDPRFPGPEGFMPVMDRAHHPEGEPS